MNERRDGRRGRDGTGTWRRAAGGARAAGGRGVAADPPHPEDKAGAGLSDGNDLDIPQCWPVPIRASARFRVLESPRPLSKAPASDVSAGSGRPSREASAAVAGFEFSGAANSGLVGCLSPAQPSSSTGVFTLGRVSADPRQAQTPGAAPHRCRSASGPPSWRHDLLSARGLVPVSRGLPSRLNGCQRWVRETDSPGILFSALSARIFRMLFPGCSACCFLCLLCWRSPPP